MVGYASLTALWCVAEAFWSSARRFTASVLLPLSVSSSSIDMLSPVTSHDFISSYRDPDRQREGERERERERGRERGKERENERDTERGKERESKRERDKE